MATQRFCVLQAIGPEPLYPLANISCSPISSTKLKVTPIGILRIVGGIALGIQGDLDISQILEVKLTGEKELNGGRKKSSASTGSLLDPEMIWIKVSPYSEISGWVRLARLSPGMHYRKLADKYSELPCVEKWPRLGGVPY